MSCEIDHEAATHPTAHMQMTQQEARMPHTVSQQPDSLLTLQSAMLPRELSPSCLRPMQKASQ